MRSFSPERTRQYPTRELFEQFIASCFQFFLDRQDLFKILMKEAHRMIFGDDPEKTAYFLRQKERINAALVPPLETAMRRGELKPLPAQAVAHMIMGNINGCQMHMMLECREDPSCCPVEETAQSMARFLTTMLFDGLLADPAGVRPSPERPTS
ncbi:MAG: hypothetical protein KatS3mg043_0740 [Rhodothermaceae bacterium]|nr:MAG: hypothetical protein KatS3mg043_0740 [Rhodothermaceae bacterium]